MQTEKARNIYFFLFKVRKIESDDNSTYTCVCLYIYKCTYTPMQDIRKTMG